MIKPQIRVIAGKRGITNAYQLQKIVNLPIGHAYRLWKDDWKQIKLETLNELCKALKCTPGDLLKFTPDPDE